MGCARKCTDKHPERCLYEVESTYSVQPPPTTPVHFSDDDRVGGARAVRLFVWDPVDAPDDLPVLFLSPAASLADSEMFGKMEAWATVFAEAGYLTVAVDHIRRSATETEALCTELDVPTSGPNACDDRMALAYDRPLDVSAALDWLQSNSPENEWASRIVNSSVGHMGHDAGASTSLMLAGAPRAFGANDPIDFSDTRFQAIMPVALANDYPSSFVQDQIDNIALPTYLSSGEGMYESSDVDVDATETFLSLPVGDKYLLYFVDEAAGSSTFALDLSGCQANSGSADCAVFQSWLTSSSLAFSDAHLSQQELAIEWLATENMVTAVGAQANWRTR